MLLNSTVYLFPISRPALVSLVRANVICCSGSDSSLDSCYNPGLKPGLFSDSINTQLEGAPSHFWMQDICHMFGLQQVFICAPKAPVHTAFPQALKAFLSRRLEGEGGILCLSCTDPHLLLFCLHHQGGFLKTPSSPQSYA